MRILSYLLLLLIVVFGMTFATLNSDSVTVNYYFNIRSMPLSLLLTIVFVMGCLLGMIVGLWMLFKAKLHTYRVQQKLSLAEKEIENLRAIPLQDKV